MLVKKKNQIVQQSKGSVIVALYSVFPNKKSDKYQFVANILKNQYSMFFAIKVFSNTQENYVCIKKRIKVGGWDPS